ncbi:restriction endonuclease subunit S [Pseudobutyrivibrio sp.]|uniref:restriction endonuclease subunit S n=1 Tax=Pseudobutyrivibrio sp. TaxID=2014367 RepID=UPI0025D00979|nr:restriction endonuclease subunit S [Pseudobutyrivibrio sp.]
MTNRPNIRFGKFNDDWEQRKFPEFVEFYNGQTYTPADVQESGTLVLRSSNVKNSEVVDADNVYINPEKATAENVKDGDIIVVVRNGSRALIGKHAEIKGNMPNTVIGAFMTGIRSEHSSFVNALLGTTQFEKEIEKNMGATINQITGYMFSKMEFMIPEDDEQEVIGKYFKELDKLITLHQRKCDETKELKKYMLQKMFPKNGEKKPEIRFTGFIDDWEQRKFGEITELKSASRVHKEEWTPSGVPFYRSSDVMSAINGTENEKAFISKELYEKLSSASGKLEEGDVLVTGGGSVGNPFIVPNNEPLYTKDADLLWIKNQGRFDAYFIYEFFFSPTFRSYLGSISHVGTIAHYTITQLSDTPISLPTKEEQKQIGNYFRTLDNLIVLHQRKCDEIKEVKKYMLQNLFVK